MGDPVSASEYYQLHNSFTKRLLDSKSPYMYCFATSYIITFIQFMSITNINEHYFCILFIVEHLVIL